MTRAQIRETLQNEQQQQEEEQELKPKGKRQVEDVGKFKTMIQ